MHVDLLGWYGGDNTHAASAWTSTSTHLNPDRVPGLLRRLAANGHGTPFEKSTLHFRAYVDQATHIHLLKHRIGVSINGESARYKEIDHDDVLIPTDWPSKAQEALARHASVGNVLYHHYVKELTQTLGAKRANESARYFRTMNNYITLDMTFNFRSFVHFYRLRAAPDAQLEVRQLAAAMLALVKESTQDAFLYSIVAFELGDGPHTSVRENSKRLPAVCGQVCGCGISRRVCQGKWRAQTVDEDATATDGSQCDGSTQPEYEA